MKTLIYRLKQAWKAFRGPVDIAPTIGAAKTDAEGGAIPKPRELLPYGSGPYGLDRAEEIVTLFPVEGGELYASDIFDAHTIWGPGGQFKTDHRVALLGDAKS